MSKGSTPRPVAVPTWPNYAPDGLTEADIDALIAEVDAENAPTRPRPGWLSADSTKRRRDRHRTRQAARLLASNWIVGGMSSQGKTSVIRAFMADALPTVPGWDEVA
jgi:hypothetical protein